MEQLRAVNALEPFVILSKSATSPRAAADLISQATSSPHTYVFAELLQTPNIQALRNSSEYANHLKLLEIFAWGTWADYQKASGLPKLSPPQQQKLLLLSLLPLARQHKPLSYDVLSSALSLSTSEALEALITSAIYNELIEGSLDPHSEIVHIDSVAPLRDLPPGSVKNLSSTFDEWSARCEDMLNEIEKEKQALETKARSRAARNGRIDQLFDDKFRNLDKEKQSGGDGADAMDVDAKKPTKKK